MAPSNLLSRLVFLGIVTLLLGGCEQWANVAPATETPAANVTDGGGVVLGVGQTVRLLMWSTHSGFETQGFACDVDSDSLVAKDPSIVAVVDDRAYTTVKVNNYDTRARSFTVIGLREGDVVLTGTCSELETTISVKVTR